MWSCLTNVKSLPMSEAFKSSSTQNYSECSHSVATCLRAWACAIGLRGAADPGDDILTVSGRNLKVALRFGWIHQASTTICQNVASRLGQSGSHTRARRGLQ